MYKIWYFNNNFQNIYMYMYMYTVIKLVFLLFVLCCSSSWSACIYNKIQLGESRSVCTCNFGNWCRMFKEKRIGHAPPPRPPQHLNRKKNCIKHLGIRKYTLKYLWVISLYGVNSFIYFHGRPCILSRNLICKILINVHVYWDITPFCVYCIAGWSQKRDLAGSILEPPNNSRILSKDFE